MNAKKLFSWLIAVAMCVAVGILNADAAPKSGKPKTPKGRAEVKEEAAPLSATGEKLQAQYASVLTTLKTEIAQALPNIDGQKKAVFLKMLESEMAAEENANDKRAALSKNRSGTGLLNHHNGWLAKATKGVAEAKEKLQQAQALTGNAEEKAKAVKAAQEALAKIQANCDLAAVEVKKVEAAVEKAKLEEPKFVKELEVAQEALAKARAATQQALKELNLESFLASDKLDAKLAKYEILTSATPRGLAEFAEKGQEQAALIEKLLADDALMKQMVAADGAEGGKYGRAMEIYTAIQKASAKAGEGLFQRLALAVALELTMPPGGKLAKADTDEKSGVDPVKRYLHFEKAYLDGELDPGFKDLTAWDYRMVVNGNEPDSILAWGREMLRNYRSDQIATPDYRWRYVQSVKTDVKYGSSETKNDIPTLHNYQNIINTGGVCGRRAFFGRFILRCFGIPTVARPQKGHAALAHWTPKGWVINLGAGWGAGKGVGKYATDLDFLAMTQARTSEKLFLQVQRAQWIGNVLGEEWMSGLRGNASATGFWNIAALCRQRQIIADSKAVTLDAVGQDIAEANESKEKDVVVKVDVTDADKKIEVAPNGVITIPAVACSLSTNGPTLVLMKSVLGGLQMHYNRTGPATTFAYTFDAPKAGKYALSARVVTVSPNQNVAVTVNDAKEPVVLNLPYTIGMWQKSEPVEIALVKGTNILKCDRHDPRRGLTIKDFTLTPVK